MTHFWSNKSQFREFLNALQYFKSDISQIKEERK